MKSNKILLIVLAILILIGIFAWTRTRRSPDPVGTAVVTSFQECADAGYPVMESYPRQCRTPDGRTYAEEIPLEPAYANASADLIKTVTPFPGAVTGKEFSVTGEARGTWFFEASFPIEIVDPAGVSLAIAVAHAQGDWMTEEFVPFKADISIPESYLGPATVILRKDNPSGLPEHDASMSFPITIEY